MRLSVMAASFYLHKQLMTAATVLINAIFAIQT